MLSELINAGLTLVDTPGSVIRGLAAGDIPRAFQGIIDPSQRYSGRDVLQKWGVVGENQDGFDAGDVAGFGVDLLSGVIPGGAGVGIAKGLRSAGRSLTDDMFKTGAPWTLAKQGRIPANPAAYDDTMRRLEEALSHPTQASVAMPKIQYMDDLPPTTVSGKPSLMQEAAESYQPPLDKLNQLYGNQWKAKSYQEIEGEIDSLVSGMKAGDVQKLVSDFGIAGKYGKKAGVDEIKRKITELKRSHEATAQLNKPLPSFSLLPEGAPTDARGLAKWLRENH